MIEVTFVFEDGTEAGTLRMEHIPRRRDEVLWLTDGIEGGREIEIDNVYPVESVQWTLHADQDNGHRDGESIVHVFFGPAQLGTNPEEGR